MDEMRITLRVIELRGGGFILAEEIVEGSEVTFDATQAVSSIDEACGSVQRRLREWHQECKLLRIRQNEDEADVIPIKKAWRRWRAIP